MLNVRFSRNVWILGCLVICVTALSIASFTDAYAVEEKRKSYASTRSRVQV